LRIRDHPRGQVRYFLVERGATRSRDPVFYDRILDAYPSLTRGRTPDFLRLVHENRTYALFQIR
jgi:hypothetical protein